MRRRVRIHIFMSGTFNTKKWTITLVGGLIITYLILTKVNWNGEAILSTNADSFIIPGTLTRDFALFDTIRLYNYKIDILFNDFPMVVKVSIFVVISSIITMIFITFMMFNTFVGRKKKDKFYADFAERYTEGIETILKTEEVLDLPTILKTVGVEENYWVKTHDLAEAWLLLYLELYYGIEGFHNQDNILRFLDGIGLLDYCHTLLLKGKPNQQARILQLIRLGRVPVGEGSLSRLLNHRDKTLAKSARLLFMLVNTNNPYHFMDNRATLTTWDAMELHALLQQQREEKRFLPSFLSLIRHAHSDAYISYLIREWGFFGEETSADDIYAFINKEDENIQLAVVDAAAVRGDVNAVPYLQSAYPTASRNTRVKILDAMLKIGSQGEEDFLETAFLKADSYKVKLRALHSLRAYSAEGFSRFEQLKMQTPPEQAVLFKHIESDVTFPSSGYELSM